MEKQWLTRAVLLASVLAALPVTAAITATPARAQVMLPPAQAWNQERLDQLVAPIALYPDQLLGQVLMASTYPQEVAEAAQWRGANPALMGGELSDALAAQDWDPSVKSLAEFPQVLVMMYGHLDWTEQLGDAFLSNQSAVMDSVQRLRLRAQSAGTLVTCPQLSFTFSDGLVTIAATSAETVYVPYYDPAVVFAPWPYADYRPYYFPPAPGFVSFYAGPFGFDAGVPVVEVLWGWDRWDWRRHLITLDEHRWAWLNHNVPPPAAGGWHYDPGHRHGVPYVTAAARDHFEPVAPAVRAENRGFGYAAPAPATRVDDTGAAQRAGHYMERDQQESYRRQQSYASAAYAPQHNAWSGGWSPAPAPTRVPDARSVPDMTPVQNARSAPMPEATAAPMPAATAAPMFKSFNAGDRARTDEARGNVSRASFTPAQHAPAQRAPEQRPADRPQGGGGGGHDRH